MSRAQFLGTQWCPKTAESAGEASSSIPEVLHEGMGFRQGQEPRSDAVGDWQDHRRYVEGLVRH